MADFTKILFRQGNESTRKDVIYSRGEPIYVVDYKRLFVGDGVTYGGSLVGNKFLGFTSFNLGTNATGVVSAYSGDLVFDFTTNNLYALTGVNPSNFTSYARITRNFTADNVTTTLTQTSAISVKSNGLNATHLNSSSLGRGLEKNPNNSQEFRLEDPDSSGGLYFEPVSNKLSIKPDSVTDDMLESVPGFTVKGNLGDYGSVGNVKISDLANAISQSLLLENQTFGVPIGTIIDFAGANTPEGYFKCDGRMLSAGEYPELYAAIENTWGGTYPMFALPDMRRKTTVGSGGTATTILDSYVGAVGGSESVTLQRGNVPSHTHGFDAVVGNGSLVFSASGSGYKLDTSYTDDGSVGGLNEGPLGQPFGIIQPSAVVTKCIRAY